MGDNKDNILDRMPEDLSREIIEVILEQKTVRIERIISMGHASPPGFWYDQDMDEFVILLKGSSGLLFDGEDDLMVMGPGDYINIPAHKRHRVEWTDPSEETVWMAVYY